VVVPTPTRVIPTGLSFDPEALDGSFDPEALEGLSASQVKVRPLSETKLALQSYGWLWSSEVAGGFGQGETWLSS